MELPVAKSLIAQGVNLSFPGQVWADFGAGDGLFTKALAELLPPNSKIFAVDKDERALKKIAITSSGVELEKVVTDLTKIPARLSGFDGIVMANSLHYIKDQRQFLENLKTERLKASGVFILVEYNLDKANMWVPYPIHKKNLIGLAKETGFELEIFTDSVKSKLNSSEIYSALLKRNS
jgi:ubiquinone/menaquinone biosynthesis C-methylase UbiE